MSQLTSILEVSCALLMHDLSWASKFGRCVVYFQNSFSAKIIYHIAVTVSFQLLIFFGQRPKI